jgi:hypothetical protein
MIEKCYADAFSRPISVGRQLAYQKTGDGVGRLPSADGTRERGRHYAGWGDAVVSDHPQVFVDDIDGRETLLLVRQGARLQPVIERRLSGAELSDIMLGGNGFGLR